MTGFWKVTARMLWRQRLYTVLNVAGLTIGLTAAMLILLQVAYEYSYDQGFSNADRIHRVTRTVYLPGQPVSPVTSQSIRMGPALAEAFAEDLEHVVRTGYVTGTVRHDGQPMRQRILVTDPGYFVLFDRPVVAGDPVEALSRPAQAVLTVSAARRYFGDADPIGQVLELTDGPALTVAAVVADSPLNISIPVGDVMASMDTPFALMEQLSEWGNNWVSIFVMLRPGVSIAGVEARFPEFLERTIPDFSPPGGVDWSFWMRTHPLAVNHLGPYPDRESSPRDGLHQITLLAGLLVLIAVVNYTNLATARSGLRAREVALRKTLGARRGALMRQFLGESLVVAALAGLITLALVELLQPAYAALIGQPLDREWRSLRGQLAMLAPLVLIVGVLGGVWPGLVLSAFKPAAIFRQAMGGPGGARLRLILVIGQFAAAIVFGIAAWVIHAQFQHASSERLGFDKENVVLWRGLEVVQDDARLDTLVDRVEALPGVRVASVASWVPGDGSDSFWTMVVPEDPARTPQTLRVEMGGVNYLPVMGAELLAGRLPDPARADDVLVPAPGAESRPSANVVVSRSLVEFLGFGTPEEALGRTLQFGDGDSPVVLTVVGVVADFQFDTARQRPTPTVFTVNRVYPTTLMVRMGEGTGPEELARVEGVWKQVLPDLPVVRHYLDERIRALHNQESLYGRMFGLLAVLAIVIANLGLFGLAAFTAERRTKEIGVRKVLGADTPQIVRLLVWQFSRPVALAWLIAAPVAWIGLDSWLSVYANRIELTPWPFLVAGACALLLAWATVAGHAWKVARRRPVTALRYE